MTSVYEATYRSSDGSLYVDFDFRKGRSKGYRIYITSEIDYGDQDTSSAATHRIFDDPYDYICWDGRIATLEQAEAVAALWADVTALYIRELGDFDTIAGILSAYLGR